jgi:ribosome-associated protein
VLKLESIDAAHEAVDTITQMMGESVVLLDLQGISIISDFYVIATGTSERHLKAMARAIIDNTVLKRKVVVRSLDEQAQSGWVLIDLGDVMVHLFMSVQRNHYSLEQLWSEGRVILRVQ